MHREEQQLETACAACGAVIVPASDRGFAFGEESALCFECALARGGHYDSDEERWSTPPRTRDLERG